MRDLGPEPYQLVGLILAATLLAGACAVTHIDTYEPKRRVYQSPVDFAETATPRRNGALFQAASPAAYLFADQRAMRPGDIVTIRVDERADARRAATTDLTRDSNTSIGADAFFGLLKLAGNALPAGDLLKLSTGTGFKGSGLTSRMEDFEATVPAIVREVLPNGNLFLEGHRVVLVNSEEHHFYVSGVVRPADIEGDNSISSSKIADAEIEFTGRGLVSEKLNPGWLQRGLDIVRPF